jgi:prophage regulatory protein
MPNIQTERLVRLREVLARTGLARSTVYLYVSQGRFPTPVPLGSPRAVGWVSSEIDDWINRQIAAARGRPTPNS